MLFGRLVHDRSGYAASPASPRTVAGPRPRFARRARAQLLVFARWVLVMTHFERGLYAQPDADHDTGGGTSSSGSSSCAGPTAGTRRIGRRRSTSPLAPVYYHNYLFGEMVASQLAASTRRHRR